MSTSAQTKPFVPNPDELGALWVRESGKGEKYLSVVVDLTRYGVAQKVNLVAFKNKDKKSDKQPDYRLLVSNRDGAAKAAAPQAAAPQAAEVDI